MRTCYIICAGDADKLDFERRDGDLVIAADAGLEHCRRSFVEPDVIIGDFDSLGSVPAGKNVVRLPVEKDYTDSYEAVMLGMSRGFRRFVIYGALGGERLDHTLANIALLAYISKNGCTGAIVGNGVILTAVTDGSLRLKGRESGTVSVLSFDGEAVGVTETGLKYKAQSLTLENSVAMAVSNSFIGEEAQISVEKGTLIIYFEGKISDIY